MARHASDLTPEERARVEAAIARVVACAHPDAIITTEYERVGFCPDCGAHFDPDNTPGYVPAPPSAAPEGGK
jgi:hypothetical protein